MHGEYKVSFPDHDWEVDARHKLIPSVYAGIEIHRNGHGNRDTVGFLGPTFITIRSGKHSASTALRHGFDFEKLLCLTEFDTITRTGIDKFVKPILMLLLMVGRMKTHGIK